MRTLIVLILCGCWGAFAAAPDVQKVYVMPMAGGLDQYLADALTREGMFKVVLNPKQAEAVLTERVDPSFAGAMDELYPPPKPQPAKDKDEKTDSEKPALRRSMGRARGTIFLVGVSSRQVMWSTFLRIEDTSPRRLHRAADEIVKNLKKDLKKE